MTGHAAGVEALRNSLANLGVEHPAVVYNAEGYQVWLEATVRRVLRESIPDYQLTAAALEKTCQREEAQRGIVNAALSWCAADDAFGDGTGPPPIATGTLDSLREEVHIYRNSTRPQG